MRITLQSAVLCFATLLFSACNAEPQIPPVQSDIAPIGRRVELPQGVIAARWIATTANVESGWLEAPDKPLKLYVWLELSQPHVAHGTAAKTVTLPKAVATRLLPDSLLTSAKVQGSELSIDGRAFERLPRARDPRTTVVVARWHTGGAWLELRVRDE
ncbi:MAG TPA: hypothetical protein VER33_04490 [Polyangiaceae bacterium]|nr:hypothetical protein [Polyangiaceae bacterium]